MLSFIIPTLNEEKNVERLLKNLVKQIDKKDEIIIVDSHSKDNTASVAKKYGAKVVLRPKQGVGLARTEGAKEAKNDVFVFFDCDCVLSPDFVQRLKKHFSNKDVPAVCGFDLYESDSKIWKFIYNLYSLKVFWLVRIIHLITGKYWIAANNCAMRKELFFKVGGYRSVIMEDTDFMHRAPPNRKVVYDFKLVATLSDRRFKEDGFFRTVALWIWSDICALFGKGIDVMKGYTKN
ncbi:MAG: glycosyltransferase [Candidatus Micrarchaeota archaeon]